MNLLIPVDVWQEEENSHLAKDLKQILPVAKAKAVLVYAMQSEPHIDKAVELGKEAGLLVGTHTLGSEPVLPEYVEKAAHPTKSSDHFYSQLEKKAKVHLENLAKELKSICASVETVFEHGSPAKIINTVAKTQKSELTIIRASAAGLLESAFLGSTISQVIKHSHNATLVIRAGAITSALQKVIVALDGSAQSKTALRQFCNLYQPLKQNIEIVLTHVVSIPGPWRFISPIEFVATLEDNLDMAGKAILAEGKAILLDCGWKPQKMPVPMIVRTGDPAVELDRLAGEIGAGLIVLGAQGKTAMQSFLLGSVSEALSIKSSFPVLIFK